MKYRHRVLGLLILLFAVVYLDRVCISVAGPRIQDDLHIDPIGWSWVTAMFTLSYCLFEIPTGANLKQAVGQREHRSEEHTSNSSHLGISYAVFCLKKKKVTNQ